MTTPGKRPVPATAPVGWAWYGKTIAPALPPPPPFRIMALPRPDFLPGIGNARILFAWKTP